MMHINFYTLILNCRKSVEVIDLNNHVLFFHGKVSSGKSSIARLINFCLGGSLERTIAIQKEVISVSLELAIGVYKVLLERNADSSSIVTATWIDDKQDSFTVSVPIIAGQNAVYGDNIFSLSDLIFYLLDKNVMRIPAKKNDKDNTSMVRLTVRNFMWYCYLDQSKLDNSFFRHEDGTKSKNSKEILKFIFQYSTQKIYDLQELLIKTKKERFSKQSTAEGFRDFLKRLDYSSEEEILFLQTRTENKLLSALEKKKELENNYTSSTHVVDSLRDDIRKVISEQIMLETSIQDLSERINQQESLRSELISSKFKVAKNKTIANVFRGVVFDNCPDCGTNVSKRKSPPNSCSLCLSELDDQNDIVHQQEVIQIDLNDRVKDLEASIDLHKKAYHKSLKEYRLKTKLRGDLDKKLQESLKQYESIFLSNIRAVDNTVSTLKERLKSIEKMKLMPNEIGKLEDEVFGLRKKEKDLQRKIEDLNKNFIKGEELIAELESTFLNILVEVGMPGVSAEDRVLINRKTWEINILPVGEDYLRWNFYNAGSGGKKTLFNTCFLLAIHIVASLNDLPIPTFIIIDTPMKNIDKEVNQDIFKSFYDYLYKAASTVLNRTQIIIIDNNYVQPAQNIDIDFVDRYMDSDDPDHPPLIPYYQGP
jgi:predicted nuclease with TOPRIM domain